jgi:hypothetical protein
MRETSLSQGKLLDGMNNLGVGACLKYIHEEDVALASVE